MMRFTTFIKIISILSISILISACGLANNYQVDPKAPHAKFGYYKNKVFGNENIAAVFNDYQNCKQATTIPMTSAPITINAGRPTTVQVIHIIGYNRLMYVFTFIPKKNYAYLITTKSHRIKDAIITTLWLKHISPNGNKILHNTPIIARKYKETAFSGACTDSNINLIKAPRTYSIKKVAKGVPLVYQWMENKN